MASQDTTFDFDFDSDSAPIVQRNRLPNGRYPEDNGLMVKFKLHPTGFQAESKAAGRAIYKDVEHIVISIPGQNNKIIDTIADASYIDRFPVEYKAFKEGLEQPVQGTPLAQWPMVSAAQVAEMKYMKIFTVEQLAGLADGHVQNIMGGNGLKEKAKQWLIAAKDSEALAKLDAELSKRDAEIAELRALVEGKNKKTEKA